MLDYLDKLIEFVKELRATNSRTEKEEILERWWGEQQLMSPVYDNDVLDKLFHYVYDYDKQYYVTSANILKFKQKESYQAQIISNPWEFADSYTLWDLLDELSKRILTGNLALTVINEFIRIRNLNKEEEQLVLDIIDKDIKCGLSEVTINKVCGNIIKTYNVALADKFDPKKHTLDSNWVIERKLDGVRCNVINKNGVIKCYSRQGKEITTLGNLIKELEGRLPNNTVLDGEICLVDKNGLESFQGIMKEIKRKNHTIENPLLLAFDYLTLETFESKKGTLKYTDRMEMLKEWYSLVDWGTRNKVAKHLSIVNYEHYNPEVLQQWNEMVKRYSWEGLMFRKDVGYEGKRTQNLLKYKMFNDAEYKVIGVEEGDAQELKDGVMKKIKCVGALVIEHKGNKVGVGTGLSLQQRKRWYEHPEEIVGKTVTIKYFEETTDQNGNPSLRFPVLKAIYDEERDI